MKPAMLVKFVLGSSVGLMAEPMVAFAVPASIGRAQRRQVRSGLCKDKIVAVTGNKFLILSFISNVSKDCGASWSAPPKSLG
jgi:hypothetical protein